MVAMPAGRDRVDRLGASSHLVSSTPSHGSVARQTFNQLPFASWRGASANGFSRSKIWKMEMEELLFRHGLLVFCAVVLTGISAEAADQTQLGAGNARAQQIGSGSPLVQSAVELLEHNARQTSAETASETATTRPTGFASSEPCYGSRIEGS
jgi:hypothetical protein